jgi:hypothetical protein
MTVTRSPLATEGDAVATAEVSPANAETCVKPFTIPDRWVEKQDPGGFDPQNSTFDSADRHGNPLANPDIYIPADQPGYTGYSAERDKGTELMIRAGTGNNINPSMYFSYAIGGDSGGSAGAGVNAAGAGVHDMLALLIMVVHDQLLPLNMPYQSSPFPELVVPSILVPPNPCIKQ